MFVSDPDWRSVWVLVSELLPWLCQHWQPGGKVDSSWEFFLHKRSLMPLSPDWQADIKTPAGTLARLLILKSRIPGRRYLNRTQTLCVCVSLQDQSWHFDTPTDHGHCPGPGSVSWSWIVLLSLTIPGGPTRTRKPNFDGLNKQQWLFAYFSALGLAS